MGVHLPLTQWKDYSRRGNPESLEGYPKTINFPLPKDQQFSGPEWQGGTQGLYRPGSTFWRSAITYPLSLSYPAQAGPKGKKKELLAPHHSTVESWEVPAFVLGSMPTPQAPLEKLLPNPFVLSPRTAQ